MPAPLSTDQVWQTIDKRSFGTLSWVTPRGEARNAGIVYTVRRRRLFIGTGNDSWKAKHIRLNGSVALNINIPKRIPFMPWVAIPDATIAFHGTAALTDGVNADNEVIQALLRGMSNQSELRKTLTVITVEPKGHFVTYGVGVPLLDMRDPEKAGGRVSVA
ncbi:MAG: pyridoxamine 5'-phosphate oxidase family protein [Myxococcota bacterium]